MTAIFDQYPPAIYKYTLRLCHDPIVADNIVGDVFAQLLEQFAGGKGPRTNLRSYLYQTAYQLVVDRSRDNQHNAALEIDIVIPVPIVSRHHAFIERIDGRYQLAMLPGATNPLYFEGRPLQAPRVLHNQDTLRIGGHDPGMMVSLTYNSPEEAVETAAHPISFGENPSIQIGRDPSNDVILDNPQVSRFHAQLERIGKRHRVRDLRSSNGTFVNDQRIAGETWLKPEDTVRIGPYRFIIGEDRLLQVSETHGLQVDAVGLHKWVRKDLNLLQNISLTFQPRSNLLSCLFGDGGAPYTGTFTDAACANPTDGDGDLSVFYIQINTTTWNTVAAGVREYGRWPM